MFERPVTNGQFFAFYEKMYNLLLRRTKHTQELCAIEAEAIAECWFEEGNISEARRLWKHAVED